MKLRHLLLVLAGLLFCGATLYNDTYTQFGTVGVPNHIASAQGTKPGVSACGGGTPTIANGSTDNAGEVTLGTGTPVNCTITFNRAFSAKPWCVVTWQTNLATMAYAPSTVNIVLTQTATSSNVVNWVCIGQQGG